jgi:iron(III) transport system ATP-binding protein
MSSTSQISSTSQALSVVGLAKTYPGERKSTVGAVRGIGFHVDEGEFYTLLGPSGCGKTTTLRCVAGLERPDSGTIVVAGTTVSAGRLFVPPSRRDIGMVFQSYAIWPHMTVFENVAFPLRVNKTRVSRAELDQRVQDALATVALDGLESRMATALSGGQQQRLALARALVRRPKLLLLDEPLSNLDAKLRDRLRAEVRKLQRRLGITTLYVTHDQAEALSMSTRIAVLNQGEIVQEGRPRAIYQHPESSFVASFVGASNFIEGRAEGMAGDVDGGDRALDTALGGRPVYAACPPGIRAGDAVTVAVRRENVELFRPDEALPADRTNTFDGRVAESLFVGDCIDAEVTVGATTLVARCHPRRRFRPGDDVIVRLPRECCVVLTEEYGVASASTADDFDGASGDPSRAG